MRRLSSAEARRIAVRAQRLDADRPTDLLDVVTQLGFVQLDPTAAIAPSADLVAWSRLGSAYRPEHRRTAMEDDRTLFEHLGQPSRREPGVAMLRPMADLGLFLAEMRSLPTPGGQAEQWLTANARFRRRVLDQLRDEGPLLSRDIPDTCEQPWASTGWTNARNVTKLLELLLRIGDVAVSGRRGAQRVWDVAERVYPASVVVVPMAEAVRMRAERRLRSLGVTRPVFGEADEVGEPVEVEGTDGEWRLDPTATADGFVGRTALLSPFDRLVHDRARAQALFDFDYTLEMYKPAAKRQWGYFALPILHGDRLVGKLDATVDRRAGVLRVDAVHPDVRFTKAITAAVDTEIEELAAWLGVAVRRA